MAVLEGRAVCANQSTMSVYDIGAALYFFGLAIILMIIGWCVYIRISPFHVIVNRIPGPSFYLPIIGNSLEFSGSLDRK